MQCQHVSKNKLGFRPASRAISIVLYKTHSSIGIITYCLSLSFGSLLALLGSLFEAKEADSGVGDLILRGYEGTSSGL